MPTTCIQYIYSSIADIYVHLKKKKDIVRFVHWFIFSIWENVFTEEEKPPFPLKKYSLKI